MDTTGKQIIDNLSTIEYVRGVYYIEHREIENKSTHALSLFIYYIFYRYNNIGILVVVVLLIQRCRTVR